MDPTSKKKAASKSVNFEQAFNQLEELVDNLENSDLALEDALKTFEQGIQLTQRCQNALNKAEQKIQVLMEKNNKLSSS